MSRVRLIRRLALIVAVLVVAAGIVAPFINADRFGERVREALERSLGRKVQTGRVRLNLFTGPGFTIDDVLINEDPLFGIEPFAHVQQLDARIGLASIWTGRLSFSRLRLVEPSVNLVRRSEGGWNLVALLDHAVRAQGGEGERLTLGLPSVEVRSGHLYFKRDDTKSGFYLMDADVDISPRYGGLRGFDLKFSAGPARTDRTAQSFATIRGRGQWEPGVNGDPTLDLDVELEKTGMEELVTLIRGQNFGVHGTLASRARISGPISAMQVTGQLRIDDVHRWDLMPQGGGWNVRYSGLIDWRRQTAALAANEKENPGQPLLPRIHVEDFLNRPRWSAEVRVKSLPADNVMELARHLGAAVPPALGVDGKLDGIAGYAPDTGWSGTLVLDESDIRLAKQTRLRLSRSEIALNGSTVNFGPTSVTGAEGEDAGLEASWDLAARALDLTVRAKSLSIAEMQSESGHLSSAVAVPFLEGLERGRWSGLLRYRISAETPGVWTGAFEIRDALAAVPGLADPVRLRTGSVVLAGDRVQLTRVRAHAGGIEFAGEYRYEPLEKRPHQFNLVVPETSLADLEKLFLPLLRREQGFFARTLRFKPAPPPDWLRNWHAEGSLRVGDLTADPIDIKALRANVVWDGALATVTARSGRTFEGSLRGTMLVDLTGSIPKYHLTGNVKNADWRDGKVDVDGVLDTRGTGSDWLANLVAKGEFQARGLAVLPEGSLKTVSGAFNLAMSATGPALSIDDLQASTATENYVGRAMTQGDGTLRLDLATADGTNLEFVGPLAPLRLELAESKP